MFNYNDIIEYEDETWDENFNEALQWCNDNDATLVEDIEARKSVEYEEWDEVEQKNFTKTKLMRYFTISQNEHIEEVVPEPEPLTNEQIKNLRAMMYQSEVDPITSHIQRLRDEEQTPEVIAEIASLVEERKAKVEEIKQKYPYQVEPIEVVEENSGVAPEEVIEDGLQG